MIPPIDAAALFMLGLSGTGHCIGMCGPLVVAFPGQTGRLAAHLAYHFGRLITYTIIGTLMGAVGSGLMRLAAIVGGDPLIWISGVQVVISLAAGVVLVFLGLSRLGLIAEPGWLTLTVPMQLLGRRHLLLRHTGRRGELDLFLMGLLLGALPCGLSYAAFAKALAAAHPLSGAGTALIFGLGTLPGLLAVGAGAGVLLSRYRRQADTLAGLIMIGMAAVLLVSALEAL